MTGNEAAGFGAFDVHAPFFSVYSSREGGVIDVSAASSFIHTNNANYSNVAIYGNAYVGERAAGEKNYIGNLTVICKTITNEMHGSTIRYYGTTFVQSGNSVATHFFRISRISGGGHVRAVENCTFIVTKASTAFLHYADTNGLTFKDCNFVCTDDGIAPLFSSAITNLQTNPKFLRCNFYNVLPAKNLLDKTIEYTVTENNTAYGCSFGFSGIGTTADIDLAEDTAMYIVRGAAEKTIVANGVAYILNAELSTDPGVLVTFKDEQGVIGAEYWKAGTTVTCSEDLTRLDEANGCMWKDPSCEIITDANGTTANVIWGVKDAWAFAYEVSGVKTYVYTSECGETATDIGDKFYELFANPAAAYTITMYSDMYLTKAMGFGPIIYSIGSDGYNRDRYDSMAAGAITWDLNGTTVTIDKDLVGINLAAANFKVDANGNQTGGQNSHKPAVFGFECNVSRVFTLKSSKAGAQIINNSTVSLFGVGEGKSAEVKIDDANNNITIRTAGQLFANVESYSATAMTINGGTYVYEGTSYLATISRGTKLSNATFICTNGVTAVFCADGYRWNSLAATNCTVFAPVASKLIVKGNGSSSAFASATQSSTFRFENCDFVNVTLVETLSVSYKVDGVSTTFPVKIAYTSPKVSADADLAIGYADADLTDLVLAYSSKTVNGEIYKLIGYYAENQVALVDWGFGITENWLSGATAIHADAVVDGMFGYSFNTFVVGEGAPEATLVAFKPGALQMNLTLQSKIGLNLLFTEALSDATVTLDGVTYTVADLAVKDGYYLLEKVVAPNKANDVFYIVVVLNGNEHTVPVSIGAYAEKLLGSEEHADAHNLAYAMVEYVREMTKDESFLASVSAPAGYEEAVLEPVASNNDGTLLEYIAFRLDGTIAIAVKGDANEIDGMKVTLTIAGSNLTATVSGGEAIFEGLYVNEFIRDFTVAIGNETYTYNLANYLDGLTNDQYIAGVQALYNYAFHAAAYVETLQQN